MLYKNIYNKGIFKKKIVNFTTSATSAIKKIKRDEKF
jgi:hypothetical protein